MNPKSDAILTRMMSLHPKFMDLTLDRTFGLLEKLGNPQRDLPPVIHIAGTNGKGSTQAMIRAGLQGAGLRVHAYTSPHLAWFHERIVLAGKVISEPALTDLLAEVETINDGASITFFEITTAAAMLAFTREPADYTLLEVGLGGISDTTNVVDTPRLTIITPVSLDHQAYLGDTIEEITVNKAGILKPGVPCVVGPQSDAGLEVIRDHAARIGARLLEYGQDWHVWEERGRLIYQDENGLLDLPMPALIGAHQVQNAGMAICALRILGVDETAVEAALTDVTWPARMQRLKTGPLIDRAKTAELWLDGGHNPAAGLAIAESLGRLPDKPLYLICGMLNTKDIAGYLSPLAPLAQKLYGVSIPGETATLPAETTAAAANSVGLTAHTAGDVETAIDEIINHDPSARILICGSLYLAGHILRDNA